MIVKIGIDLGTTNSLVAYEKNGKTKIAKFESSKMLPSVILYKNGEIIVGSKAKKRMILKEYSQNVISSSKTHLGSTKTWDIENRKFTPTDVAVEILKAIKGKIEKKLKLNDDDVIEAVITTPAYFTSNQRDETKIAGERAGLVVKKITSEPIAAAIAYGKEMTEKGKIFVVDLGGGTFDVTILESNPEKNEYEIIRKNGDKQLGGDDFNKVLFDEFVKKIKIDTDIDLSNVIVSELEPSDYYAIISQLMDLAEKTKIRLSKDEEYEAILSALIEINEDDYDFKMKVTRKMFESLSQELLNKIEDSIKKCFDDDSVKEKINIVDITKIVLVGGSSNIPVVAKVVEKVFNKKAYSDSDLDTMVVRGASIYANSIEGIESTSKIFVKDIIAHSLGIEVLNKGKNEFSKILLKGDNYPCENSNIYKTAADNQQSVELKVFEGEFENDSEENEFYGGFVLDNIENAKKGVPQIKVTFKYDENCILNVTAEDLHTGSKKEVKIIKGDNVNISNPIKPIDFSLLIDCSGSMGGMKFDMAKEASKSLITDTIDLNVHKMSIIGFGWHAEVTAELTNNEQTLLNGINRLSVDGNTNMTDAIKKSSEVLAYSDNQKVVIIVSDGAPNSTAGVRNASKQVRDNGYKVISIGVGSGVNSSFLTEVSDDYYYIDNMSELSKTFEKAVNSLSTI